MDDKDNSSLVRQRVREEQLNLLSSSSDSLRNSNIFTDVILICGNQKLLAHRVLLAASSPYFYTLFVNHSDQKHPLTIDLSEITPDIMEIILEFIYTGNINVSEKEVGVLKTLLSSADQLLIGGLFHFCAMLLLKSLTIKNYNEYWNLAEKYKNRKMKEEITAFISKYFLEISEQKDFLLIPLELLNLVLQKIENEVLNADCIMKAVLKWVKWDSIVRKSEIKTLCSHINFQKVSSEYLQHIIDEEPLVNDSMDLMKLIMRTLSTRILKNEKHIPDEIYLKKSTHSVENFRKAESKKRKSFFLFRKLFSEEGGLLKRYDLDPSQGSSSGQGIYFKFPLLFNSAVCLHDNYIYLIGGIDKNMNVFNYVIRYDIALSKFETMNPLLLSRFAGGAVGIGDYIFIAGGISSGKFPLASVEKFSLSSEQWQKVAPMNSKCSRPALVGKDNRIYIVRNNEETVQRFVPVEFYDLVSNQWTSISMQESICTYFLQSETCFFASNDEVIHILIQSRSRNVTVVTFKKDFSQAECILDTGKLSQNILYFSSVLMNGKETFVVVDSAGNVQKYKPSESSWEIVDVALEKPNYVA